jgi:hypothetical protein
MSSPSTPPRVHLKSAFSGTSGVRLKGATVTGRVNHLALPRPRPQPGGFRPERGYNNGVLVGFHLSPCVPSSFSRTLPYHAPRFHHPFRHAYCGPRSQESPSPTNALTATLSSTSPLGKVALVGFLRGLLRMSNQREKALLSVAGVRAGAVGGHVATLNDPVHPLFASSLVGASPLGQANISDSPVSDPSSHRKRT